MLTFTLRRLIQIPVVLLVLSILIVGLTQLLTPEARASGYIRSEQQAAQIDKIIRDHGFDQPFPVQYGKWLNSTLHGDLGFSKTSSQPVLDTIAQRLPATLELAIMASIPIILIGVWFGTLSALHKDKLLDQIMRVFTVLGYSLPTFVLGILMLKVFYGTLGWAPGPGQLDTINQFTVLDPTFRRYTGMLTIDGLLNGKPAITLDVLRHLILPVLTLTIVSSASIIKVMRAQMLEALSSDYVRTARSKGLPEGRVTGKHARRNALLPVVTLAGFTLINLLGGSIITETIFAYPGIGQWAGAAAGNFDIPAVLGFGLVTAVIVVILRTLTDVLYGVVDPRVRFD
ncbi:ABC transporter permease [Deinococcus radiomollis]|uniref:ABC transporter permease n=1 Tax=Deinococcus radiomollis TaxID=468916 RepID=UPI00389268F9